MLQTKRMDSTGGGIDNGTRIITNSIKKMENVLKIWQAVIGTIIVLITIFTLIINQSNKIETQRLRIEFLENSSRDNSLLIKDLNQSQNQQYKEINVKLTDILIALQNKQNKR